MGAYFLPNSLHSTVRKYTSINSKLLCRHVGGHIQQARLHESVRGWLDFYQVTSRVCEVKRVKKDYTMTALKDYSSTESGLTDSLTDRLGYKEDY